MAVAWGPVNQSPHPDRHTATADTHPITSQTTAAEELDDGLTDPTPPAADEDPTLK